MYSHLRAFIKPRLKKKVEIHFSTFSLRMFLFSSSGTSTLEGSGGRKVSADFQRKHSFMETVCVQGMGKTGEPFYWQDTQIGIWVCQDSTDAVKSDIQNC